MKSTRTVILAALGLFAIGMVPARADGLTLTVSGATGVVVISATKSEALAALSRMNPSSARARDLNTAIRLASGEQPRQTIVPFTGAPIVQGRGDCTDMELRHHGNGGMGAASPISQERPSRRAILAAQFYMFRASYRLARQLGQGPFASARLAWIMTRRPATTEVQP